MKAGRDRRQWMVAAGSLWAALLRAAPTNAGTTAGPAALPLHAPAPLAQLHVDRHGALLAVARTGDLWQATASDWKKLGAGLDPAAALATGHGRVVGRSAAGGLWVWEAGRVQRVDRPVLAPHAGLLVLAFGIVAVTDGNDGNHRVVRLDPDGATWAESARGRSSVLPDARPLQFDPEGASNGAGADDNGHVIVFGAPSDSRLRHGVLGDAVEPTALMLLDRHDLAPMAQIELPPPYVFEDIAPRPVAWRGGRALLTIRSGPLGAQLCVVALARSAGASGSAARLELAALGEPIGAPNRWLSPSTDGQRLLSVVTPHLGGVLHRHAPQGDRLPGEVIARGLSNHSIGQRDLDVSAWVWPRWVVPAQARRQLLVIDVASAPPGPAPVAIALPGVVLGLKAWRRGQDAGVAVLLQDGSAWWVRISGGAY